MRKIFYVILELTHLPNGIFQNVQERYTKIHEVVGHPFFTNNIYPDNRFFKPFQKQATVMDEERVWLFSKWSMKTLRSSSECEQICRKLRICSHLLKTSLMENFNFYKVAAVQFVIGNIFLNEVSRFWSALRWENCLKFDTFTHVTFSFSAVLQKRCFS